MKNKDLTFIMYLKGFDLQLLTGVDFYTHTLERKTIGNVGNYLTVTIL